MMRSTVFVLSLVLLSEASILPRPEGDTFDDSFGCVFDNNTKSLWLTCDKAANKSTNECGASAVSKEARQEVKNLSISKCQISTMFDLISSFPNIQELSVTFSRLDSSMHLPLQNLPHLLKLNLSHNGLSHIPEAYFENAPQLTSVDLSYNEIKTVDLIAFIGANSLKKIDLSYNKIKGLLSGTFVFTQILEELILIGNSQPVKFYDWTFPPDKNVKLKANTNGQNVGEVVDASLICHKYEPNEFSKPITVHVSAAIFPNFKCFPSKEFRTQFIVSETRARASRAFVNVSYLHLNEYPTKEMIAVSEKQHKETARLLGSSATGAKNTTIFGFTSEELETVGLIILSISVSLVLIFIALIIRDHLVDRLKIVRTRASCRPNNIVRIKAIENEYVFRNI